MISQTSKGSSRDLFPRHDDRVVIQAFLTGRPRTRHATPSASIAIDHTSLVFTNGGTVVAWYDTAGALCAKLSPNANRAYSVLAINQIMVELGQPEKTIVREIVFDEESPVHNPSRVRHFFDGTPIATDQPFVLAGPVGVLAYRASLKPQPAFREPKSGGTR